MHQCIHNRRVMCVVNFRKHGPAQPDYLLAVFSQSCLYIFTFPPPLLHAFRPFNFRCTNCRVQMPHNKLAGRVVFTFYTWWLRGGSGGDAESFHYKLSNAKLEKCLTKKCWSFFLSVGLLCTSDGGGGGGKGRALVALYVPMCVHHNVYIYNKWHKV